MFFPPELVPAFDHPIVVERGPDIANRILVQRLYAYLQFTIDLEQIGVLPIAQLISRSRLGLPLPEPMIADAYRICTDEAWHAQFSHELLHRIVAASAVKPRLPEHSHFLRRADHVMQGLAPEVRRLAEVLFTIVSETLISAILRGIPADSRIHTSIRDVVRDHSVDEARHHAYFGRLLTYVWPSIGRQQETVVGPLIPQFIRIFLEPDFVTLTHCLSALEFSPAEIRQILAESYPESLVTAGIIDASRSTVRHFEAVGAFKESSTVQAFQEEGLL
jgi:hypothetical protein